MAWTLWFVRNNAGFRMARDEVAVLVASGTGTATVFLTASYGGVPGAIASVLLTALAAAIAVASLSALSRRRPVLPEPLRRLRAIVSERESLRKP